MVFALTFRQFIHYYLKIFIYYSIVQQALILNIFMYDSFFYIAFNILFYCAVHKKITFKSRAFFPQTHFVNVALDRVCA